jgi:hypothetical protein
LPHSAMGAGSSLGRPLVSIRARNTRRAPASFSSASTLTALRTERRQGSTPHSPTTSRLQASLRG